MADLCEGGNEPRGFLKASKTIAGGRLDLLGQLRHDLPVDDGVHVPAQHVEDPPVADVRLARYRRGHLARHHPVAGVQQVRPQGGEEDDGQAVQQQQAQHRGQDHEPEPQEDVRLFVDDVERQDAQRVVLLDGAGGAVLVEGALGDAREHEHHGVHAVLLRLFRERHDAQAVADELPVEEAVHEVQLRDDVDQAQRLAEVVPDRVHVVPLQHETQASALQSH
ncbi:hypothetical protein ANN_25497 [Periplaneta americana]|uniref:Uncharacterized protein n=1 Tax=Periplaneta americana TaxID=6978 RepID=A0ABQ8S1E1_PERAM|nr:hypothetical protein ANN_25497 [Periplaneta americana]